MGCTAQSLKDGIIDIAQNHGIFYLSFGAYSVMDGKSDCPKKRNTNTCKGVR